MTEPRTPWKQIDPQLLFATRAPSGELRQKALQRLVLTTGLHRSTLLRRMRDLGLSIHSAAGERALAKYNRIMRLSFQCSRTIPGVLALLRSQEERQERERQKALLKPLAIPEAARQIGVEADVLYNWIRWWKVLEPDAQGRVTPKQLEELKRSDWKWFFPMLKLPKELFSED